MGKEVLDFLKHTIVNAVPCAMGGAYHSNQSFYEDMVSRYYPENREIYIGNMGDDRRNYSSDIEVVFRDYKRGALKEINRFKSIIPINAMRLLGR